MQALVFAQEWVAVIAVVEGLGGLAVLGGVYRLVQCQRAGCRRFGRFRHGHLRLCSLHHPLTPDDGQVTAEDISAAAPGATVELDVRLDRIEDAVAGVHAHVAGTSGQAEPARERHSSG